MMPIDTLLDRKNRMINPLTTLIAQPGHILLISPLRPIHLRLLLPSHSLSPTLIIITMFNSIIIALIMLTSILTHPIDKIGDFPQHLVLSFY